MLSRPHLRLLGRLFVGARRMRRLDPGRAAPHLSGWCVGPAYGNRHQRHRTQAAVACPVARLIASNKESREKGFSTSNRPRNSAGMVRSLYPLTKTIGTPRPSRMWTTGVTSEPAILMSSRARSNDRVSASDMAVSMFVASETVNCPRSCTISANIIMIRPSSSTSNVEALHMRYPLRLDSQNSRRKFPFRSEL